MADIKTIKGYGLADQTARNAIEELKGTVQTEYIGVESSAVDLTITKAGYYFTDKTIEKALHIGESYDPTTGLVVPMENGSRFDPIPVKPGSTCKTTAYGLVCVVYDANMRVLTSYKYSYTYNAVSYEVTIPDNGRYFGFASDTRTLPTSGSYAVYHNVKSNFAVKEVRTIISDIYIRKDEIKDLGDADAVEACEAGRYTKNQMVHAINAARDAIRVSPFNIYGANYNKRNWDALKTFLEPWGLDIVGFTECFEPMGSESDPVTFESVMKGWDLKSFSTVGTLHTGHCASVATNGKYEIITSEEVPYTDQSNYGKRHYTRCEIRLPMYNNRKWSEHLKMSFYCTQLELSAVTGAKQAQQLCDRIATDPNPFIIVAGDFNDETYSKTVWKVFVDNGLTPIFDSKGSPTAGRGWYDNLFVCERISKVGSFVECIDNHQFSTGGNMLPLSDHAFPYADLHLDYTNVVTFKKSCDNVDFEGSEGIHADIDYAPDWFDRRAGRITIHITPHDGYRVKSLLVWDGDWSLPNGAYPSGIVDINGNTVSFDADKIYGDFVIKVTTEETT